MQPPTVREVISRLRGEGWKLARTKGDHRQFQKDGKVVTVAGGLSEHLKRGTYSAISKTAGW